MIRKSILVLLGVLVMAGLTAIPAGAGSATLTSSAQKVFKSDGCRGPVYNEDPSSWACTTITVNPWTVNAGDSTTVRYTFKARHKVRYVSLCFTKIASLACAYRHKRATIKRGYTVTRVVQLQAPNSPGEVLVNNITRVYKTWDAEQRGVAYWTIYPATVNVVSSG